MTIWHTVRPLLLFSQYLPLNPLFTFKNHTILNKQLTFLNKILTISAQIQGLLTFICISLIFPSCDYNKYTMQYIIRLGEASGKKESNATVEESSDVSENEEDFMSYDSD